MDNTQVTTIRLVEQLGQYEYAWQMLYRAKARRLCHRLRDSYDTGKTRYEEVVKLTEQNRLPRDWIDFHAAWRRQYGLIIELAKEREIQFHRRFPGVNGFCTGLWARFSDIIFTENTSVEYLELTPVLFPQQIKKLRHRVCLTFFKQRQSRGRGRPLGNPPMYVTLETAVEHFEWWLTTWPSEARTDKWKQNKAALGVLKNLMNRRRYELDYDSAIMAQWASRLEEQFPRRVKQTLKYFCYLREKDSPKPTDEPPLASAGTIPKRALRAQQMQDFRSDPDQDPSKSYPSRPVTIAGLSPRGLELLRLCKQSQSFAELKFVARLGFDREPTAPQTFSLIEDYFGEFYSEDLYTALRGEVDIHRNRMIKLGLAQPITEKDCGYVISTLANGKCSARLANSHHMYVSGLEPRHTDQGKEKKDKCHCHTRAKMETSDTDDDHCSWPLRLLAKHATHEEREKWPLWDSDISDPEFGPPREDDTIHWPFPAGHWHCKPRQLPADLGWRVMQGRVILGGLSQSIGNIGNIGQLESTGKTTADIGEQKGRSDELKKYVSKHGQA